MSEVKKECASTMTYYAVTFAEIRIVARKLGYALALHGSLQRDLDVIAVPWTEDAADEATLVEAIIESVGGALLKGNDGSQFGLKPHGRKAYTICFCGCSAKVPPTEFATFIDLSVMPKK